MTDHDPEQTLKAFHDAGIVIMLMSIAEKMQKSMQDEMGIVGLQGFSLLFRFLNHNFITKNEVAEQDFFAFH